MSFSIAAIIQGQPEFEGSCNLLQLTDKKNVTIFLPFHLVGAKQKR